MLPTTGITCTTDHVGPLPKEATISKVKRNIKFRGLPFSFICSDNKHPFVFTANIFDFIIALHICTLLMAQRLLCLISRNLYYSIFLPGCVLPFTKWEIIILCKACNSFMPGQSLTRQQYFVKEQSKDGKYMVMLFDSSLLDLLYLRLLVSTVDTYLPLNRLN